MPSKKKIKSNGVRGVPPTIIDWDVVDQNLIAGATGTQIAASFGIHPDTLYGRCEAEKGTNFSVYAQEKRSIGDKLIHAKQFQRAIKDGNIQMLLHLGKHRLGQKDHDERTESPKEEEMKIKAEHYAALYRIQLLEKELNALKSQASEELQRSDPQV